MYKQKQIEEMARDMDYGCIKRDLYPDDAKEIAKALYLLGYRKITKNVVVLTEEKYINLFHSIVNNGIFYTIDKVRKETAEKFAEKLKEYSITEYKEFGALRFYKISYPQLDELVEEMTK